jgi:holin-like protein
MIGAVASGGAAILLCLIGGYVLKAVTGWFVPVPVWGLILLLVWFAVFRRVPAGIRLVGEFLLRHMSLFFIPPTLGLIGMGPLLKQDGLVLGLAIIVSTTLGLVVTAFVFNVLRGREA